MLDIRTNQLLSRLQTNAPRLVTLALAVLIAIDLGRIALALLSKPVNSPQPVNMSAPTRPARPAINVQNLAAAHLFGTAVIDPGSQDPNSAPMSSANVMLAGTIATGDPKHGVAIVSDGGGPSRVYSVGDRIAGASLYSVYLDHVVLDRNGSLETVVLPRQLPPGIRGAMPARRAPDLRTAAAVDNIRHLVQQDPAILDQVMRTVPSYDNAAGKLRGFRAFPGKNRQIFSKLGLKSGDLVTAINGTPLDDPQRSQEVFNTIQTSDHVVVTIERSGQKQDISLNIAQVAQDATQELQSNPNGSPATGTPANVTPANAAGANDASYNGSPAAAGPDAAPADAPGTPPGRGQPPVPPNPAPTENPND